MSKRPVERSPQTFKFMNDFILLWYSSVRFARVIRQPPHWDAMRKGAIIVKATNQEIL